MLNSRFRRVLARPHCLSKKSLFIKLKEPKRSNRFFFGLLSTSKTFIKEKQVEAIKKLLKRFVKKRSTLSFFLKIPFNAKTAKPAEVRMGKGKGKINTWIYPVSVGSLLLRFTSKAKKNKLIYHKVRIFSLIKKSSIMFPTKTTFFNYSDFNS